LSQHFQPLKQQPSVHEIKTRLLYTQSLEAARAFDEGILTSARDADVGSILGWGFAAQTGGVFSYVDAIGVKNFVQHSHELAKKFGPRFAPPAGLEKMARDQKAFYA
jgi:3-hydroxyacyl-CoA dehydrogenase/enoyl-CoA hydratase/3-hydroxybutyryl-CoA epimerase